jgi:uncharacterized membrane protein YeiH
MIEVIEFLAVIASALFGVILASRHHMDVVGVVTIAFAVSFGGGTLRDLFLDRSPLFWIGQDRYAITAFGIAIAGALLPRVAAKLGRFLHIPDAIGMGLFSIVGAAFALEAGTSMFIAAILGTVTGTFGGVIGDVLCNQVPTLFRSSPLCATCAFAGTWCYLLLGQVVSAPAAMICGISVIVVMRLAAVRWNIVVPMSKW